MSGPRVEIGVLGTSTLVVDGVPAQLNARRMRALLAALILGPGRSVSSDRLVQALWERQPSAVATNTLQGYISRMRRLLEPDLAASASTRSIQHAAGAYLLTLGPDSKVDAHQFDAAITNVQGFLRSPLDPARPQVVDRTDRVEVQRERLDRALATWRGEPFVDLADDEVAAAERRRLAERRVDGQTALLVMDLMLGRASEAAAGLEEMVAAHPLREQLWRLWAVALVRSDRQAHALEALRRLRVLLSSELGIDPSPAVAALQEDILRQDPSVLGHPERVGTQPHALANPSRARTTTYPSPLLGRDRELKVLQDAVRATVAGRGRHAVVVAEPGMGKTRLVAEVLGWAGRHQEVTTVMMRGSGHGAVPPLWSLTRAVADLSTQTGIVAPDRWREPTDESSFENVAAFADYVRALALLGPVVLVADDLHRIDQATVGALAHLVEDVVDLPVMLLVTRRPGMHEDASDDLAVGIARAGGLWLELPGLDTEDTRRLASFVAPDRLIPDSEVERLRDRAGGNPLHLAMLLEQATEDIPPPLVALVRAELRRLPPGTAEMLGAAAVAGPRLSTEHLLTASDPTAREGSIELALDAARRSGLVRCTNDVWEFESPVIHEAVLALLARRHWATTRARPSGTPPRTGQLALVTDTRQA